MSHLANLKNRINSIKTTKKITHAMRLIAMSLYSKLDKEQKTLEYYQKTLKEFFEELSARCPEWENHTFFPTDLLDSSPLFIVISATKGFCGGINNILFQYTEQKLVIEEHQKATFITIGKKATNFVNEKNLGEIIESYHDLKSNNFTEIARKIADLIMQRKMPFSSVSVYSSIFKNFFTQRPIKTTIIPLQEEVNKIELENIERLEQEAAEQAKVLTTVNLDIDPLWEQDKTYITNVMAEKYLHSHLTHILFQALIAEYASRFVAMDGATTNAENYLETLTLQFNKMRQALITREVSELSASL